MRWDEKQLQDFIAKGGKVIGEKPNVGPTANENGLPQVLKQSKHHNVICEADNIKFRSKKERKRYLELRALQDCGECWFLRQVPFFLPGKTKYLLDFMVFWKDGKISFEDVKGHRTPMYIMKKKQVQALYPIIIEEL